MSFMISGLRVSETGVDIPERNAQRIGLRILPRTGSAVVRRARAGRSSTVHW